MRKGGNGCQVTSGMVGEWRMVNHADVGPLSCARGRFSPAATRFPPNSARIRRGSDRCDGHCAASGRRPRLQAVSRPVRIRPGLFGGSKPTGGQGGKAKRGTPLHDAFTSPGSKLQGVVSATARNLPAAVRSVRRVSAFANGLWCRKNLVEKTQGVAIRCGPGHVHFCASHDASPSRSLTSLENGCLRPLRNPRSIQAMSRARTALSLMARGRT